jgi:DNA polymerase
MSDQRILHEINRLLDAVEAWTRRPPAAAGNPGAGAGRTRGDVATPGVAATPAAADIPAPPAEDIEARRRALAALEEQVRACTLCPLHEGRTNGVPGMGVLDPLVMIIGEGPGAEEDRKGLPFVGRAGQYLDKWLQAIGLSRDRDVYITNIVKCRPPGNRDPQTAEIDSCTPYLRRQIDIIRPRSILAVGRFAGTWLSGQTDSLGRMRGRTFDFRGVPVVVTYHPSGVLRNPEYRRPVWEDLKRLRELYAGGDATDPGDGGGDTPGGGARGHENPGPGEA